jgi:predicted RNA binding protein YcfA (HicA-like mRNA interferase family)
MTGKDVVKLLRENAWILDRVNGSHHILKKDGKTLSVPVHANRDLPKGLLIALLKEAGLR